MEYHASIKRISKVKDKELRFNRMEYKENFISFKDVILLQKNSKIELKSYEININTIDDIEITIAE